MPAREFSITNALGQTEDRLTPARPVATNTARISFPNIKDMHEAPSVRQLHQELPPVTPSTLCCEVLSSFLQDASIYALPVIDASGVPYALIERNAYIELFSRSYSNEVFGKKPLAQMREIPSAQTP